MSSASDTSAATASAGTSSAGAAASDRITLGGLAIEGPDAVAFLQGYLTSDTEKLTATNGQPTALTTLKGRVLANGWALTQPAGVLLLLAAELVQPVMDFLSRYMAFSKSKARALGAGELENVLAKIELAGVPDTAQPLAPQLFTARLPLVTSASSDQFLPQMLGLTNHGAVDFAKGCYLGQEIVARAQHRGAVKRTLMAFTAQATAAQAAPAIGDPIHADDQQRATGTVVLVDATGQATCSVLAVMSADAAQATDLRTDGWSLQPIP